MMDDGLISRLGRQWPVRTERWNREDEEENRRYRGVRRKDEEKGRKEEEEEHARARREKVRDKKNRCRPVHVLAPSPDVLI